LNLILFDSRETRQPLPQSDFRAVHLLEVLRRRPGDTFDAGLVNGPRGRGTLVAIGDRDLTLDFTWGAIPPPPDPISVIIGLPRPQTARDVLRDASTLGVAALHFAQCEKTEAGYAQSTLWRDGEWRRHVLTGVAQAFDTHVPEVTHGVALAELPARLPANAARIALDNYEATGPLARIRLADDVPLVLAIGPERGWSAGDRIVLQAAGFTLAGLGPRPLRTETAVVAALTLVKAGRGSP
jgi:RsmE family RNA methyltransferase